MSRDRGRGLGGRRGSWRRWRGPGCGGGGGGGGGPRPPGREGGEAGGAERLGPAAFTLCTCSGRPTDRRSRPHRRGRRLWWLGPGPAVRRNRGPVALPRGTAGVTFIPGFGVFGPQTGPRSELGRSVGTGQGCKPPPRSPVRLGSYSPARPDPPGLSLDRVLRRGTGEGG